MKIKLKVLLIPFLSMINTIIDSIIGLMAVAIAPVISRMARTGAGTNICLRWNCLPMPVHFHSPVPDIKDLEKRRVWDHCSPLSGISFRSDEQVSLLLELGQKFGYECVWPQYSTNDPYQFFTENPSFSYGCAASLHCILRNFKPGRVIEVGSGKSSLVISSALLMNDRDTGERADYIIVDPYPAKTIEKKLPAMNHLIKDRVETLEPGFFEQLSDGDVLFIDSGHVARIGSDVNFLILDVLPRLKSGVVVHFHDISLPNEYDKVYATNPKFRMFWTEAYLLQAFLCYNHKFNILLAMNYLMNTHPQLFRDAFPSYDPTVHKYISGSFWIRSN